MRIVVVLPAPFGPITPRHSPGMISSERSSTTVASPNFFVRCEMRRSGWQRALGRLRLALGRARARSARYSAATASVSTGSGRSTSSTNAIGALSPTRKPIFRIRV